MSCLRRRLVVRAHCGLVNNIRRTFTTAQHNNFEIRRISVDDATLIKNKEEYRSFREQKIEEHRKEREKNRGREKTLYFKKQWKESKESVTPAKFSHPLLIVDVSNLMSYLQRDKYFSHVMAATDLHRDLRNAIEVDSEAPKKIAISLVPESPPTIEIALVLEKYFRQGAYEGTVGNGKVWLRTIHAPDTREINHNAGDNAIVVAAQWAREEERHVTIVTSDVKLLKRVKELGCKSMTPVDFISNTLPHNVDVDPIKQETHIGQRLLALTQRKSTAFSKYKTGRRGPIEAKPNVAAVNQPSHQPLLNSNESEQPQRHSDASLSV